LPATSRVAVVLCLVPWLFDCDCGDHDLHKGKPVIGVEPEQVEFRALNLGEEDQAVIRVDNLGTAPLRVESITLDQDDVFELAGWDDLAFDQAVFPAGIPQPGAGLNRAGSCLFASYRIAKAIFPAR